MLIIYFNSIKVRLKPWYYRKLFALLLFQFHKGTIKTTFPNLLILKIPVFQFHKGTIKTLGATVYVNPLRISIP